jgi:hypothetical protein
MNFFFSTLLMTQLGGLKEEELASKLVYFGVDGVSTFQCFKYRIIVQIQCQYGPFITIVHCMVHMTNLAIQILLNLLWCLTLKVFCNICMFFFSHNLKIHLEFTKLVEIMETKGNKILCNIKTRWISIINPIKHVLSKYHIIIMKITLDSPTITPA